MKGKSKMSVFQIHRFVVGPVATNCYFAVNVEKKEAIVVDPGDSGDMLAKELAKEGARPVAILLTHGHFDHAAGIEDFKKAYPGQEIPVYTCEEEKETLGDPSVNLSAGMNGRPERYSADVFLKDGEEVTLAGYLVRLIFTPGHTPGGCCFYLPEVETLFSGDTLFCGSVGRTDFPGGSMATLVRSIREKLFSLPDVTRVYPGHDSVTTIGEEKCYNPFL